MKLAIIGTGYVGLVTAVSFAELGHQVIGVDEDAGKVARLRSGDPVIFEPGLEDMLRRNLQAGRLQFTTSIGEGVEAATILFICVGTPPRDDGSADLSQVERVTRIVADYLTDYRLLVEKSTVPVHTARWIERTVKLYNRRGVEFDVASNPEFTREGTAVEDFLKPDRLVIGVSSRRAADLLLELYSDFDCPKIVTDVNTSEIIKHASNSFLATKISFINMVADLCERAHADIETVAEGMGLDRRVGQAFLRAGLGYGGACLPKDVSAFMRIGEEMGSDMSLLRAVNDINQRRIDGLLAKVRSALWVVRGKTIALWGIAFKPNTDDIRGAPALEVARCLLQEGAHLRMYDPQASTRAQEVIPPGEQVSYAGSALEAAAGAHVLIVATEWEEFRAIGIEEIKGVMATPIIVDGRNLIPLEVARSAGVEYFPVGRVAVNPLQ